MTVRTDASNRALKQVISGGQIGADIAGVRAAQKLGYKTGGWMPLGWETLRGPRPEYATLYGMQACEVAGYPARTARNVRDSDMTIRFATNFESRGELATLRELQRFRKPYLDVALFSTLPTAAKVRKLLSDLNVRVLNVAGNANEAIEEVVEELLLKWLK